MIESIAECIQRSIEIIERRAKNVNAISGVPSGFSELDDMTDGFHEDFIIIGGRPSMGKSALVRDMIVNAAKAGFPAHIVNIEDGNHNTVLRQMSGDTGIPTWKLRKGILKESDWHNLYNVCAKLSLLPITFDDVSHDEKSVERSIRNAVKDGARIVVVDYLQLVRVQEKSGVNRVGELRRISQMLKALSKKSGLGIPVIAVAQLNRDCEKREDKRPQLSDLRESGDIEQDADIVMFLYREGYYSGDKEDKRAELSIRKGRNIGTGVINLIFNDKNTTFREIAHGVIIS